MNIKLIIILVTIFLMFELLVYGIGRINGWIVFHKRMDGTYTIRYLVSGDKSGFNSLTLFNKTIKIHIAIANAELWYRIKTDCL
jgi:hypothetical protein